MPCSIKGLWEFAFKMTNPLEGMTLGVEKMREVMDSNYRWKLKRCQDIVGFVIDGRGKLGSVTLQHKLLDMLLEGICQRNFFGIRLDCFFGVISHIGRTGLESSVRAATSPCCIGKSMYACDPGIVLEPLNEFKSISPNPGKARGKTLRIEYNIHSKKTCCKLKISS
jgi:hypothetical protein